MILFVLCVTNPTNCAVLIVIKGIEIIGFVGAVIIGVNGSADFTYLLMEGITAGLPLIGMCLGIGMIATFLTGFGMGSVTVINTVKFGTLYCEVCVTYCTSSAVCSVAIAGISCCSVVSCAGCCIAS